jgi:hypothetical protein
MAIGAAAAVSSTPAHAENPPAHAENPYSTVWTEPWLATGIGVGVTAGAGVMGFTDANVRNATSDVGGLWDLRVKMGTHIPIGIEVSYVGTAQSVNAPIGAQSATLLGTAVEPTLHWNMVPHEMVTPYAFGGVGWQRYDITGASFSRADSGINDSDNLITFPVGVGVAFREHGFVADLRGTYRFTTNNNLIAVNPLNTSSQSFARMDYWSASANAGFEF